MKPLLIKYFCTAGVILTISLLGYFALGQQFTFTRDLLNLGVIEPDFIKAYDQIKLPDAWQYLDRINPPLSQVKIGFIDSGVDAKHPEFENVDLDGTSEKARIDRDPTGHGTQVAGIVGANNISFPDPTKYVFPQMNGILSGVKNLDYSLVVDYDGGPNLFRILYDIFDLAVIKKAKIVNISSGLDPKGSLWLCFVNSTISPIFQGEFSTYFNTLFIIPAGEITPPISNIECFVPADLGNDLSNVITVGGLNSSGEGRWSGSPFGEAVNISAPAVDIYAPRPPYGPEPEGQYEQYFGGTSASAPMVAGVAGILKAIKPELTPSEIKDILIQTADPITTDQPIGGRLNAANAIAYLFPPIAVYLNDPTDISHNSMVLSWDKNEDPDFESHRLYRDTNPDVGLDDTLVTNITNRETLSFEDTNLSPNTTYYYRVFVFDAVGLSSSSNEVNATTLSEIPAPGLADTPWPMFQHDLTHTGQSEYLGPQTANLKWSFDTGSSISSSPIIGFDGIIYIGSGNGKFYALNPDGSQKWVYDTGINIYRSTPVLSQDGTIYFGAGYSLYALTSQGQFKWKYSVAGPIGSSPAIGQDGTIYFGSEDGCVYAINPDGTLKWTFYYKPDDIYSSPAIAIGPDGTIYIGSELQNNLYALTPDGNLKWFYHANGYFNSSPSIAENGTIYIGSGPGTNFALHAINPDGSQKWIHPVDSWIYWSSPAVSSVEGTIFIGSYTKPNFNPQEGKVYAVGPDGSRKWTYTVGGKVDSSPAIGLDGTIYIGSDDGKIQALNPSDGSLKWEYTTAGPVTNSSAIDGQGNLFIGSYDGKLYCFGE